MIYGNFSRPKITSLMKLKEANVSMVFLVINGFECQSHLIKAFSGGIVSLKRVQFGRIHFSGVNDTQLVNGASTHVSVEEGVFRNISADILESQPLFNIIANFTVKRSLFSMLNNRCLLRAHGTPTLNISDSIFHQISLVITSLIWTREAASMGILKNRFLHIN